MGAPDIFLRSKVPEDMFYILQQFAEIRKLSRLSLIRDFNLFPETEKLLTLERKYGDSLNTEDMTGKPGKKKKKDPAATGGENVSQSQITGKMDPSEAQKTGFSVGGSVEDLNKTMQTAGTLGADSQEISPNKQSATGTNLDKIKVDDPTVEEPEVKKVSDKRKADTDCKNEDFELMLRARLNGDVPDFKAQNRQTIRNMSTGRPLKPRLELPDNV